MRDPYQKSLLQLLQCHCFPILLDRMPNPIIDIAFLVEDILFTFVELQYGQWTWFDGCLGLLFCIGDETTS